MTKDKVLQMKITLKGIVPSIWRQFQVESTISFHQLHHVIQTVMGWTNSHLYSFTVDGKEYQNEESVDFSYDDGILGSRRQKINILALKHKFSYLYDFGDCWEHELVVEKILDPVKGKKYPLCLDGERNCPPEDCGGIYGYHEMMKIRKDKSHPSYQEMIVEWLGEDYEPGLFVNDWVNAYLHGKKPKAVWMMSR